MKKIIHTLSILLSALVLWSSVVAAQTRMQSQQYELQLEVIAENLVHPWSLVFLSDDLQLVTERAGRLRLIQNGVLHSEPLAGLPNVAVNGQGGLLDIALHPDFAANQWLYLTFSHSNAQGMTTQVIRARFDQQAHAIKESELIFEALPRSRGGRHFGSRLIFDNQGYLYISVGDRGDQDRAQDGMDHAGSIIRLHDDGRIPEDNPFVSNPEVLDELFTLGNRNPQGLTFIPDREEIWSHEHGPRGGDEINLIQAGANYGWPITTFGRNYNFTSITDKTELPGIQSPLLHWTPSIAPSGLLYYDGAEFPLWNGNLLSGALAKRLISRVSVTRQENGYRLEEQERLLQEFGKRIRDIKQAPDGSVWIVTDEPKGQVIRMTRAE